MNRAELLADAVTELAHAETLEGVQAIVRSAARQLVDADGATFVLREGDLCFYADEDAASPLWKGQRFPLEQCISGWAMLHREVARIPDITVDERIPQEAYRPTFVESLVMVPIDVDEPLGAIGAYWAHRRGPSDDEVELLQELAGATAAAVHALRTPQSIG